jgi:hypothetical protein
VVARYKNFSAALETPTQSLRVLLARLAYTTLAHRHRGGQRLRWSHQKGRYRHPASRGTRTSMYIGRYRHPASRGTRTSMYIGRYRHPASRGIRTSMYIVVCV